MTHGRPATRFAQAIGWLSSPPMRYPNAYVWLMFFSAMDIICTWIVLHVGGYEANPLADLVIGHWGRWGAIGFKFALMLFVVIACELVGRRRPRTGQTLSIVAVAITAFPVAYALYLLMFVAL